MFLFSDVKEAVNPAQNGTKCGALYVVTVPPGGHACVYWKIESNFASTKINIDHLRKLFIDRKAEADAFYQTVCAIFD